MNDTQLPDAKNQSVNEEQNLSTERLLSPLTALETGLTPIERIARTIIERVCRATLELAFIRNGLECDEWDEANRPTEEEMESLKRDTFWCLTGDETGCNEPEDLNASNCELIWLLEILNGQATSAGLGEPELTQPSLASLPKSLTAQLVEVLEATRYMELRDGSLCWCRDGFADRCSTQLTYRFEPNSVMVHCEVCQAARAAILAFKEAQKNLVR